jgi:hypothetical protein
MSARAMVIIVVSILAACSNRKSNQILTLTLNKEAAKAFIDKQNATKLATQLEKIHSPATVTIEGEMVSIRLGQAPIRDVRRAICHRSGSPSRLMVSPLCGVRHSLHRSRHPLVSPHPPPYGNDDRKEGYNPRHVYQNGKERVYFHYARHEIPNIHKLNLLSGSFIHMCIRKRQNFA